MSEIVNGSWEQTQEESLDIIEQNTADIVAAIGGISGTTPSIESAGNSTSTPLVANATFVGATELNNYNDVMVTIKSDQDGIFYMQFSPDGANWDSSLPFRCCLQ